MKKVNLENQYKITRRKYNKQDTVVIDNGTYEIKGGYMGMDPQIKFRNCFYKDVEGIKHEVSKPRHKYTPFTNDVITGFHVLEQNIDQVLEYLQVKSCDKLIITDPIHSPSRKDLIDFLFKVYKFKKIQIGVDALYSYMFNTPNYLNTNSIVVSCGHSSTCVYLWYKNKIEKVYKLNYGGKHAHLYLTHLVRYKHKVNKIDCIALLKEVKCSIDYDKEVEEIVKNMRSRIYKDSVYINSDEEDVEIKKEMKEGGRRVYNFRKKVNEVKDVQKGRDEVKNVQKTVKEPKLGEEIKDVEKEQSNSKKDTTNEDDRKVSISKQYKKDKLMEKLTNMNNEEISDNKQQNGILKMRIYQISMKIQKVLDKLKKDITNNEEYYEKLTDLPGYIKRQKDKYEQIIREIELREKCRKDTTYRKTYEFSLLLKTGELTQEEKVYKEKIENCKNLDIDLILIKEKDILLEIINKYDPNYILTKSTTLDLLNGVHINKQLINTDLLRVGEVLFEPSILGSSQMGLGEILENILGEYKDVVNVFITGGYSKIEGLIQRVEYECNNYKYTDQIIVRGAKDPVEDAFKGACFSDIFSVYTYDEWSKGRDD